MSREICKSGLAVCLILLASNMSPTTALCQANSTTNEGKVDAIMTTALSRCFSSVDGVKRISFVPATSDETAEIKEIGRDAVAQLASYLDMQQKDGLTQLLAVKFLIAIGASETYGPLERAIAVDQWEVTRAQALAGLFELSPEAAKPFVERALSDGSALVRQRAQDLWNLYGH
jgi:hypothetical protein